MENLKENLLLLCDLQDQDMKIVELRSKLDKLPASIEEKKLSVENLKKDFEDKKTEYVRLASLKKEKEALLASKESLIAKHTADLNTVKSNEVYKSFILEIEKAKADKSNIEDEILQLMDDIDKETLNIKKYESELKESQSAIAAQITATEDDIKKAGGKIAVLEKQRDEFVKKINANILSQYERIRENRNGQGLALIDGDSCAGCNMVLRPQLINQATKCQELVYCDNCSRILFNKVNI